MKYQNAFYTKDGRKKRLSALRGHFAELGFQHLRLGHSAIPAVAAIRRKYALGLEDAINLYCYLHGFPKFLSFPEFRHVYGKVIAQSLAENA